MHNSISHSAHLTPHDFRVFLIDPVFYCPCGDFSNLKNMKDTGILKHSIVQKLILVNTAAIIYGLTNMLRNSTADLIEFTAHKSRLRYF